MQSFIETAVLLTVSVVALLSAISLTIGHVKWKKKLKLMKAAYERSRQ